MGAPVRQTPRVDAVQKPGSAIVRPRAVSAGRVQRQPQQPQQQMMNIHQRPPAEDPNEVARHILDLRDRRESASYMKHRKSMEPPTRAAVPPSRSNNSDHSREQHQRKPLPSATEGPAIKTANSNASKEEVVAEDRLKRAETKISGLLDELEELKFFQELEDETPSISTPKTPSQKNGDANQRKNNSNMRSVSTPRNFSQPPGAARDRAPSRGREMDRAPCRGREPSATGGNRAGTVDIPLNIRTVSPARGGRLPPPPPVAVGGATPRSMPVHTPMAQHVSKNGNTGGLETYKPLSPRAIAKLDRNSLELECQTLVRKLQIVEQERNSQAAMVEMYEISLQDQDADKAKIQKLQGDLGKVSGELKRQLQSISKGKESLTKEYDEKLQHSMAKLQRTQEKADSYKMDLEVTQEEVRRAKQETDMFRKKISEERNRAEEYKNRETTLEMQLQEARNLNATLVQKIEQKRTELSSLQNDLSEASQMLRDQELERNQQYESEINELQDHLNKEKDRCSQLEKDIQDRDDQANAYEEQLQISQGRDSEQCALIEELQSRVEHLEKETVAKFEEGKKASKTAETKKMQELVAERANQSREYERRIKAMQEQLRHQADRHHAEIQETRRRNDERLEAMRGEIRDELQIQEGEKLHKLETELSVLRRTYDEAKEDFADRLRTAQQKSRDAATDFQRQDEVRQKELDHLQDRMEKLVHELDSKDDELKDLNSRLEDSRKGLEAMESAKVSAMTELMKKDDLLEEARDKLSKQEIEYQSQLDAIKSEFTDLESRLREENHDLQGQIDDTQHQLAQALAGVKEGASLRSKLDDVQSSLNAAELAMQDERKRSEELEGELRVELAQMEGKLRASESTLKSKKTRIQELEKQVDAANVTSSAISEKQSEIDELIQDLESERKSRQQKEAEISEIHLESSVLRGKLDEMSKIEDIVIDLKRKAAQVEYELSQKDTELGEVTKNYEQTRSKLSEAEQRCTELESQVGKKDKMIERYEKAIKELEVKLQKEQDSHADLEMSIAEIRRSSASIERQKVRKETELSNLRKDYEDLSALLEENLHSSARKNDSDLELKRREREMRETIDMYNQNVNELEDKLKQSETSKAELEGQVEKLQRNLDDLNDEKLKLRSDLSSLRKKHESTLFELESIREEVGSKGAVDSQLSRKDQHMRDAIQRYNQKIVDLESRLEEEEQMRAELEDRLSSARSELQDKQQQTQEMIQKHNRDIRQVESDLANSKMEKEELKARLEQTSKDLDKKRRDLKEAVSKFSSGSKELNSFKQEHDEYRQLSETTQEELERKTKQVDELKQKIPELLSELQSRNRQFDEAKASSARLEMELAKRKEKFNESSKRYTEQIAVLEAELDSRSSTESNVEDVRAEAKRKDLEIREMKDVIIELETNLEIAQKNRDSLKSRADTSAKDLDEKEGEARRLELEKIELETKLQSQMRSKEELRSKVSELSSKLERKERELREVTDQYKIYVAELESKLDENTDSKHHLQVDIDRLKKELVSATAVSAEAQELRERIHSLETEVENYRSQARDAEFRSKDSVRSIEAQLASALKSRDEVEEMLNKTQDEKAEVIAALEGVINEVQNREDEIESLSELLHRRDEELEHAKIIATKALQSAKDIQKRFKDRDKTQQSELVQRMDDLSENVDTLSSKNETLKRKIGMLERDLREKDLECKRLKDQLGHFDGRNSFRDPRDPAKDDGSAFTQSTLESSSRAEGSRAGVRIHSGSSFDPEGLGVGSESFSPTDGNGAPNEFGEHGIFNKEVEFAEFEQIDPRDLNDGGAGSTALTGDGGSRWSHDFESDNRSTGFDSVGSRSRKSIERDALRKYVRQRYMAKR